MLASIQDIDMTTMIVSPAEIFKRLAEAYATLEPLYR